MPNLLSVSLANGVPSNTGVVSTIDQLLAQGVPISDGTAVNFVAIKGASTAAAATDKSLVVAVSPNSKIFVDSTQLSTLGQNPMANSTSVVIANDQSTIPAKVAVSSVLSGLTPSRVNAAATTNATNLKASPGQLYTIDVFNVAAYTVFLKLYNKASTPVPASDNALLITTIPIQAGGGYSKTWLMGLPFSTGIGYAITKNQSDTDATALIAGDATGVITWI